MAASGAQSWHQDLSVHHWQSCAQRSRHRHRYRIQMQFQSARQHHLVKKPQSMKSKPTSRRQAILEFSFRSLMCCEITSTAMPLTEAVLPLSVQIMRHSDGFKRRRRGEIISDECVCNRLSEFTHFVIACAWSISLSGPYAVPTRHQGNPPLCPLKRWRTVPIRPSWSIVCTHEISSY